MKTVFAILNKNQAMKLKECLDSLLNQSYKKFLVVVIDGGSNDGSVELLKEYSSKNSSVRYFIQQSKGIGPARNELLDYLCTYLDDTEIILWGDAEQVYDVDYVKNMLSVDADIVGGANIVRSDNPLGQSLWWLYCGIDGKGVLGHSIMVKRQLYTHYRARYPETITMDDYFLFKYLMTKKIKIARAPNAICYVGVVESFPELLAWHKAKRTGLMQGFSEKAGPTIFEAVKLALSSRNIRLVTFFILFFFANILAVLFQVFLPVHMLLALTLSYFLLSFYLWLAGRRFVSKMKLSTFFYIGFIYIYHYTRISIDLIWSWLSRYLTSLFRIGK